VKERYCNDPTVLRYRVGSSIGSPEKAERLEEDAIGEEIGLASCIFVFFKRSNIYHFWERRRPASTFLTSTPKK